MAGFFVFFATFCRHIYACDFLGSFFGSFIRFDRPLTNSPPLRSRKWVICRRFSDTGIPRVFFAFSGVPGRTGAGGPGDSFGYVVFVTAYVSVCVCPCHSGCSVGVVSVLEVWGVDALWWAFWLVLCLRRGYSFVELKALCLLFCVLRCKEIGNLVTFSP